jgi:hypothetical protein
VIQLSLTVVSVPLTSPLVFFFFLIFRPILQFTKRASSEIVNVFKVQSCLPQIHLCKSQKR